MQIKVKLRHNGTRKWPTEQFITYVTNKQRRLSNKGTKCLKRRIKECSFYCRRVKIFKEALLSGGRVFRRAVIFGGTVASGILT